MKPKVAVLVFGEFREFENAHKSWKFLDDIDYDFFISTADRSREEVSYINQNIDEPVSQSQILKYFPNAIINIEIADNMFGQPSTKMVHHWKKLFMMMIATGVNYDSVILIRTDIVLKDLPDISNTLINIPDKRLLYGLSEIIHCPPPEHIFVQDCLFLGDSSLMRDIFLSFYEPDVSRKCIHYHLAKYFTMRDIYIVRIVPDVESFFVMRYLNRGYLNYPYEIQKRVSQIYTFLKHFSSEEIDKEVLVNELKNIKTTKN